MLQPLAEVSPRENPRTPSSAGRWRNLWPWLAALLPWAILVNYLRLEWSANEQYGYGFVVPFLSLYLLAQLWPTRPEPRPMARPSRLLAVAIPLALLLLPMLLLAEASPEWRLIGWFLALIATGLTACLILVRAGWPWLRHFAFPLLFILVAVPWPMSLEFKVILPLMQFDAASAVEILNWWGIPALQHQNVIELPNGIVGVDEACSGIRSLQTSLMIALFTGEWLQFNLTRRLVLLAAALALTYLFNVARTLLLVSLSFGLGKEGMLHWHDSAGLAVLALTLGGLWLLAVLIRGKSSPAAEPAASAKIAVSAPWPRRALLAFALWFLLAETATQAWFDWHESHAPPLVRWHVEWPKNVPGFETVEIPEEARTTLKYASAESSAAKWQEPGSASLWLGYFLRWNAGRETSILASTHHPDVCLPAMGKAMTADFGTVVFHAAGIDLPVQVYQFDDGGQPLFVFYCVWSDAPVGEPDPAADPGHGQDKGFPATLRKIFLPFTPASALDYRFRAILQGRRNKGQQVLELGLWGSANVDEARQTFSREAAQLVVPSP